MIPVPSVVQTSTEASINPLSESSKPGTALVSAFLIYNVTHLENKLLAFSRSIVGLIRLSVLPETHVSTERLLNFCLPGQDLNQQPHAHASANSYALPGL